MNVSHSLDNIIVAWLRKIAATLSIATGVILVWNRPNVMLWALAVYLIRTPDYLISPLWSPSVAALTIISYVFIYSLGLPALIVFAARFPIGGASSATKYWDAVAADEALTRSLEAGTAIVAFPDGVDVDDEEPALPVSHARPRVAPTLRREGRVERAILVGAACNGASLDRGAIRSLHGICDSALVA